MQAEHQALAHELSCSREALEAISLEAEQHRSAHLGCSQAASVTPPPDVLNDKDTGHVANNNETTTHLQTLALVNQSGRRGI